MSALSIGKAWEDSVAFVRREWELLVLVALLFLCLPSIILQQMVPPELAEWAASQEKRAAFPAVPATFWIGMLLTTIITTFGGMALFALALRPGISVGEALRLGATRLPMLLGAFLTLMGLGMIAMLVVSLPIGLLSLVAPAAGRLIGSVVVLIGAGFALYASVRLILLNPVALDRPERPLGLLRHGWKMTRGHFWRLLAFMGMIGVVMLVVSETAQIVLGAIFGLIGGKEMAVAVGGIASAVATTIVQIYIVVMLARIYRQLEG